MEQLKSICLLRNILHTFKKFHVHTRTIIQQQLQMALIMIYSKVPLITIGLIATAHVTNVVTSALTVESTMLW